MSKFEKYSHPGICSVCGKNTDVAVCASAFGPISYTYCESCLNNYLEPYDAMVSYISCAGLFPDDINPQYQNLCRHILKRLGISEEKFIEDVKKANDDCMKLECQPMHDYMIFQCPECGAELEVWADYLIEERPADFDSFRYERRELIRHCDKCHCDWENEWCTENGDVSESQLKRKYWG